MKELWKIVSKKMYVYCITLGILYTLADYGQSFVLAHYGTNPFTMDKIVYLSIWIVWLDVAKLFLGKIDSYFENVNNVQTQNTIKKYYFNKVQAMTMDKIANTHTGYIHSLISNIAFYFVDLIWQFQVSVIPIVIGGTSILYMMCKQSIITGLICIVISGLAVYSKYELLKDKKVTQKAATEAMSKYNATFVDFVQNIVAVKKLNIVGFGNRKLDEYSEKYLVATKADEVKRSNANFAFTGLMNLLYVAVFVSTVFMVKNGRDGLPYLLFYMTALGKLYGNLNSLVRLFDIQSRFKTTKEQLDDYFADNIQYKVIEKFDNIKLINTEFSYTENSTQIKIPEFVLEKGDKVSIMGESGQGKTTVMNILAGLYPLKKGNLYIDGKECKNSRIDVVFVSQEVELFDFSIRDNLCLGKDIPEGKIMELFEDAGLSKWYSELPQGLETLVGEKGVKLSAGQKQRLNIIRGILMDKEYYFFDEPTSNLDALSEEKITNMIEKYLKNKTFVIVTHRPKLKELCNKHYIFEEHQMREIAVV